MLPGSPEEVRLEEEQQDRIKRCLRKAALVPSSTTFENLLCSVERAMNSFLADMRGYAMSDRQVHDYMRSLWYLADKPDPAIGQIRARINQHPTRLQRYWIIARHRTYQSFMSRPACPPMKKQHWARAAFGHGLPSPLTKLW